MGPVRAQITYSGIGYHGYLLMVELKIIEIVNTVRIKRVFVLDIEGRRDKVRPYSRILDEAKKVG